MSFTPFARFRNFTVENLKALLKVYPDEAGKMVWSEAKEEIELVSPGYKRTSYQQACQLGLEDRGGERFRIQTYLYTFDDENLQRYLEFWLKTYYAPNPYVKSEDEPLLIYCEIVKAILESPNHKIRYEDFFHEKIGGKSDDILLNAIDNYATPVKVEKTEKNGDYLYLEDKDIEKAVQELDYIQNNLPIVDAMDRKTFFDRFSYENFCGFFGISLELPKDSREQDILLDDFFNLIELANKDFIFRCLDIMKKHKLFNEYSLGILTDKEQCANIFKYDFLKGILYKVDVEQDEAAQKKDSLGNARYYQEKYIIDDIEYLVSSEWETDRVEPKTLFAEWIKNLMNKITFHTGYKSKYSRNRIVFGAPGTGKSYTLNEEKGKLLGEKSLDYERVTFHPNYSYSNFVGTYKPVSEKDECGNDIIKYEYVPGPFMRIYTKAMENSKDKGRIKPFLLLIEEINRANVAAVFGEVFQLLDRNEDNISEYAIQATEDMKKFLADKLHCSREEVTEIRIPDNMFIWATMNSADQGVFPIDTAFKRRWEFEYIGVDDESAKVEKYIIPIGKGTNRRNVRWNDLRVGINEILSSDDCKVNEDKLLGPFFLSKNVLENAYADEEKFVKAFESKVIMYLFDDAMKMRPANIFRGHEGKMIFSEICKTFEKSGEGVFGINNIEHCDKPTGE